MARSYPKAGGYGGRCTSGEDRLESPNFQKFLNKSFETEARNPHHKTRNPSSSTAAKEGSSPCFLLGVARLRVPARSVPIPQFAPADGSDVDRARGSGAWYPRRSRSSASPLRTAQSDARVPRSLLLALPRVPASVFAWWDAVALRAFRCLSKAERQTPRGGGRRSLHGRCRLLAA